MKGFRTTAALLGLLVVFFGIEVGTGAIGSDSGLLRLGALPDSGGLRGEYWRLLTYSLLHGGTIHLIVNCALLFWTGRIVERRLGGIPTLGIYTAGVLSGGILLVLVKSAHPTPGASVGASAGVFGLLAASLVLSYRPSSAMIGQLSRLRRSLWWVLGIGFAVSLLPGISLVGHLGGLAAGALLGIALPVRGSERPLRPGV